MAKAESDVYKNAIMEQNKYCKEIVVIPVFGLHKDVTDSVVEGKNDNCNDDTIRNMLMGAGTYTEEEGGMIEILERTFLAIEPTQRTEDLGKWFFLTTKEYENDANEIIDGFLIEKGSETEAYRMHKNDGESFERGIRRTNRPNQSMMNYATALRESMPQNNQQPESTQRDKNNNRKRRQVQIDFDDESDFPKLPTATRSRTARKPQTPKSKNTTPNDKDDQQQNESTSGSTSSSTTQRITNNVDVETLKSAFQAQIDMLKLQMSEMQKRSDDWQRNKKKTRKLETLILARTTTSC